ncbi:hypothetical protein [Saccharopolyspora gregorii]|nr:hypothetical protein [Saccharopolyspora gregorii]
MVGGASVPDQQVGTLMDVMLAVTFDPGGEMLGQGVAGSRLVPTAH